MPRLAPALVGLLTLGLLAPARILADHHGHGHGRRSEVAVTMIVAAEPPVAAADTAAAEVFRPYTHTQRVPRELVPTRANGRRLIVVGDVHGMRAALEDLLAAAAFDGGVRDRVILAGDLVAKGPDSAGVVDLAREIGAFAVRGNHEDKILRRADGRDGKKKHKKKDNKKNEHGGVADGEQQRLSAADKDGEQQQQQLLAADENGSTSTNKKLAGLGYQHLHWLAELPIILDIGEIEDLGRVVVVHAGLVPGVALDQQDPWAVMNMRTLMQPSAAGSEPTGGESDDGTPEAQSGVTVSPQVPDDGHSGLRWDTAWNTYQLSIPESHRTTVLYGHNSKLGLRPLRHSTGLDTGCVKGGALTAVVIEGTAMAGVTTRLVQVDCDRGGAVAATPTHPLAT